MRTVFIFDQCDAGLKFFTLNGDFSHLDKIYINSCGPENWSKKQVRELEKKQEELTNLLYQSNGDFKFSTLSEFPMQDVLDGARVVVIGFMP